MEEKFKSEGGNWCIFKSNLPVLSIAHKMASKSGDAMSTVHAGRVVDVGEFKSLLIHLFAISVLWAHFQHAENWEEDMGYDVSKKQLNREAFALAVQTFTKTHAHEELTQEQIDADFNVLDKSLSNSIGFVDICTYCSQFLTESITSSESSRVVAKLLGADAVQGGDYVTDLHHGPKAYYESATVDEKNARAVDALASKIDAEMQIADEITETIRRQSMSAEIDNTAKAVDEEKNSAAEPAPAPTPAAEEAKTPAQE